MQKVSPMKASQVVGTLLDTDCSKDFVRAFILLLQGLCARVHPLGARDGALRAALFEEVGSAIRLSSCCSRRASTRGRARSGSAQCAHENLHRHEQPPRGIPPTFYTATPKSSSASAALPRELEGGGRFVNRRHYHPPALAGAAAVVAIARAAAQPAAAVTLAAAAIALTQATAGGAVAVASARSIADAVAQPATALSPLPPLPSPPQPRSCAVR